MTTISVQNIRNKNNLLVILSLPGRRYFELLRKQIKQIKVI